MRQIFLLMGLFLLIGTFRALAREESPDLSLMSTFGRGTIDTAIMSADGERIAVAGNQGVWIYDMQFNDLAHLETGVVESMAWSSDDAYLAVQDDTDFLSLWNLETYQQRLSIALPVDKSIALRLEAMAWKPNRHLLTLAYTNNTIALLNAETGIVEETLQIFTQNYYTDVAWSPDGLQLTVAIPGRVQIWDAEEARLLHDISLNQAMDIRQNRRSVHIAWRPDSASIAVIEGYTYHTSNHGNTLSIIDAATGEITQVMQAGLADDVAWSPDGSMIATATAEFAERTSMRVKIWNARNGRLLAELYGHTREIHTVQWFANSQQLLTAAHDNTVRIWQVQPELPVNQFRFSRVLGGHMDRVNVVAWSPDGTQIATGGEDGSVRVWETASGKMLETEYRSDLWGVHALAWSPDGRYLATGGGENQVRIWYQDEDGTIRAALYNHDRTVSPGVGNPTGIITLAWSPDSSMLASSGHDAIIRLWKPNTFEEPIILKREGWPAMSLDWSPDGTMLVSGGTGGPVAWDTASAERLPMPCTDSYTSIFATRLSPDGRTLLANNDMGPSYLCDLATGEQTRVNIADKTLDWNPTYPLVASIHSPGTINLFNTVTLDTYSITTEVTQTQSGAWSDDGHSLALGLIDGRVQIWRFVLNE